MIKGNIIGIGTSHGHAPPDWIDEKNEVSLVGFSYHLYVSNEVSDKFKSRGSLQNNGPHLFKMSKLRTKKDQARWLSWLEHHPLHQKFVG